MWNSFQEGQKDVLLSIRTFSILSTIAFFPSAVYKNSISRYLVCMFHTIRQIFFWIFINVEKHREKWQNVFLIGKRPDWQWNVSSENFLLHFLRWYLRTYLSRPSFFLLKKGWENVSFLLVFVFREKLVFNVNISLLITQYKESFTYVLRSKYSITIIWWLYIVVFYQSAKTKKLHVRIKCWII